MLILTGTSFCRAAQELQDKRPEPLQVATTLDPPTVEDSMAVGCPLGVVMGVLRLEGHMDHQLVEGPMDTPSQGASLLEDPMVGQPQEAPMGHHLQVPMEPSSPGLTDKVSRLPLTQFYIIHSQPVAIL